ncbi:MAG TPA: tripartite tricarboxylate transporter substrate binding protein [Burkholderiaceae bacterium]|nr:tripartite tricarboxylate transporter substrate binding protein [Burkholderiaceae bacterium]
MTAAGTAAAWPTQTIRLVVPFTPGTGIDLVARTIGPQLSERLGQPVIVENRPGASGNIGTEAVVRAQPDGHTLLVSVNTLVMNRSLYRKLPYDPVRDLTPITLTSWGSLMLVVHPKAPVQSVAELVSVGKQQPGRLTYGSPGVGTPHHMAMALFGATTGAELLHVPYTGTAGAVTDLLSGQIQTMFLPVHVGLQHVKAGKLRALAISSPERVPQAPDVPTLREAGLKEVDVEMWYGVFAPRGTPAPIVERLNREIHAALASPQVKAAFESQGMVPATSTPQEFAALVERDAQRWADVVARAKITAD